MRDNAKSRKFMYWKRPWHKWVILAAAVLQLICLWLNFREYKNISASEIYSVSEWADYAVRKNLQCALNGLAAACFLGIFIIGDLAMSKGAARLAECGLLSVLAFAWGAAGLALNLFSMQGTRIYWGIILILIICGAVYSFLEYRKNRHF